MSGKSYDPKITQKTQTALSVKSKKSSARARRLIEAALEKYGTERRAARALHLPNHGQLHKMLIGSIRDTDAMKEEMMLRKKIAERAYHDSFYMIDDEVKTNIDAVATLRAAQRALQQASTMIDAILKGANHE